MMFKCNTNIKRVYKLGKKSFLAYVQGSEMK